MAVGSMNDARHALFRMLIYRVPDLADPRTRGIHDLHTTLSEQFHFFKCSSECRKNNHIILFHPIEVFNAILHRDEFDSHSRHFLVHAGIVDDLVRNVDGSVTEVHFGFDSHLDGALHTPAKSEVFGKLEGDIAIFERIHALSHLLDQIRLELVVHLRLCTFPCILKAHSIESFFSLDILQLVDLTHWHRGTLRTHRSRGRRPHPTSPGTASRNYSRLPRKTPVPRGGPHQRAAKNLLGSGRRLVERHEPDHDANRCHGGQRAHSGE
mmetsp:Transcript_31548/g.55503  ORF Transcript_31548/g.55503 Transcript_31548/m.55503 type:complete len:267 (+) Transcript_31548:814-1614(+)